MWRKGWFFLIFGHQHLPRPCPQCDLGFWLMFPLPLTLEILVENLLVLASVKKTSSPIYFFFPKFLSCWASISLNSSNFNFYNFRVTFKVSKKCVCEEGKPKIKFFVMKLSSATRNTSFSISCLMFLSQQIYSRTSPPSVNFYSSNLNWRSTFWDSGFVSNKYLNLLKEDQSSKSFSMWTYISSLTKDLINANALTFFIAHLASKVSAVGLFGLTSPSHTSLQISM